MSELAALPPVEDFTDCAQECFSRLAATSAGAAIGSILICRAEATGYANQTCGASFMVLATDKLDRISTSQCGEPAQPAGWPRLRR